MHLAGVFVPVITPFGEDQNFDAGLLKENIAKLNATGVSGYMPLGSNGEYALMSDEESLEVLKTVKDSAAGNKKVFAGTGRESAKNTVEFTKKAADRGAEAVFVLTPHYFPKQMRPEALEEYYITVARHSPVPVILYSAPSYAAGVVIEPELMQKLMRIPNIIGMKDTSSKPAKEYAACLGEKKEFSLLAGTFGKFYDSLLQGFSGGVLSSANYIPEICCALFVMIKKGKTQQAGMVYQRMKDLAKETTAPYGVPGVKAAMNILGYAGGVPRSPLCAVTGGQLDALRDRLIEGTEEIKQLIRSVNND